MESHFFIGCTAPQNVRNIFFNAPSTWAMLLMRSVRCFVRVSMLFAVIGTAVFNTPDLYSFLPVTNDDSGATAIFASIKKQPQPSPACVFNHARGIGKDGSRRIKRIAMVHMRKAGGTSLQNYLRKVAETYNLTFEFYEGRRPLMPQDADESTLLITHLREPTSRVISHYKYDMRWNCKNLTKPTFVPTLKNTKMSLNDFVETPNEPFSEEGHLWACSHNCYAKWSTGMCWTEGAFNESSMCWSRDKNDHGTMLSRAREALFSYNLIIVLEWLQNPRYVTSLETLFGLEGITETRPMYCGVASAEANKLFPLDVPQRTQQRIIELNQLDSTLYDEFTNCSFDFPGRSIVGWRAFFVHT